MKINELRAHIKGGALQKYSELYADIAAETERFLKAIDSFAANYGEDRDVAVFSVPGRSEIIGNHTDHNRGKVMAGAITRDIIAIAAKNDDGNIENYLLKQPIFAPRIDIVNTLSEQENFTARNSRTVVIVVEPHLAA